MIYIDSRKKKELTLKRQYPNAILADVTSKAPTSLVKLSPFYPHGNIPVPFSEGITATCVEAIWQGLKVFETTDIDVSLFKNNTMKNIKRSSRKYGKPLGHRKGVYGKELISYIEARYLIYLPAYKWVLENRVQDIISRLKEASKDKDIVLLDFETNCDINNITKPLSHAGLVKAFVENSYPDIKNLLQKDGNFNNISNETLVVKKRRKSKAKTGKSKSNRDTTQTSLF